MDEKYRIMLQRNKHLLVNNIIPTEEFFVQILQDKVLPEAMLRDVKEGKTREEQNSRLLNALQLRTSLAFKRFRNVLLNTGHSFLADLLWEDESNSRLVCEDFFSKFPEISSKISNDSKKRFLQYLERKIREKSMQSSWGNSSLLRMETLRAKSDDFRQERQLRITIDELQKKVRLMEQAFEEKDGELRQLSIEAGSLEKQLQQTRLDHKTNVEKQTNFNMANNNTIGRLRGRLATFNDDIIRMNEMMREVLGQETSNCQSDADNVRISVLESNLNKLLRKVTRDQVKAVVTGITDEDMKEITEMLFPEGYYGDKDSIRDIVKAYVEREEKLTHLFVKDIEKIMDSLKGKPLSGKASKLHNFSNGYDSNNRYMSNMLATVRVEVEHLNKKLVWKDAEITKLTHELEGLKRNMMMSVQQQDPSEAMTLQEVTDVQDNPEAKQHFDDDFFNQRRYYSSTDSQLNSSNTRQQTHLKSHHSDKRSRQNYPLSKANGVDHRRSNMMLDNS